MEDRVSTSRSSGRTFAELANSLAEGRARAQLSVAAQRTRMRQIEQDITQQLERISGELHFDREEIERQKALLLEQAVALERQQTQLSTEQGEWERLQEEATSQQQALAEFLQNQQDELNERENGLDAEEAQLRQVQQSLIASQRELDEQIEQLSHVRKRVDEKLAALERDCEQIDSQTQDTKSQRRRIARQLQQQRSEQQRKMQQERQAFERERAELAELRTELESQIAHGGESASLQADLEKMTRERDAMQARLAKVGADFAGQKSEYAQAKSTYAQTQTELAQSQMALAEVRAEEEKLQAELAQARAELNRTKLERAQTAEETRTAVEAASAQSDSVLQKRLAEADRKFTLAADEARELRRSCAELEEKLAQRSEGPSAAEVAQTARLTEERDGLIERLAEAEARAKKGVAPADVQQKLQDLQRRFELAVEDVRDLKTTNADLEKQLRAAKAATRPAETPAGANLDWEAQKRKLLAALESEEEDDDEDARRERLSIEGTIQITDEVIAEKQREIEELQQLLESQSSQMGGMAVGAAAIAATLDQDELIQGERRRLAELQEQWEGKLRRAEIDISVERAKIARERAALDEQLAEASYQQKSAPPPASEKAEEKGKKSSGGRWLTRLGLKDGGEEKK
jgi:chromosome segregation ATPase